MFRRIFTSTLLCLLLFSCKKATTTSADSILYFPPLTGNDWQTTTPESLGWQTQHLNDLYSYLSTNKTRAFIVLKDGKIVIEKYWGNTILNNGAFTKDSRWYWASAGKTITAMLIGIAQQERVLNINTSSNTYLGNNWSSMPLAKENGITVRHHLTMTTGLNYDVPNQNCTDPACLQYRADAGTQWYYHNAAYGLLQKIISRASGKTFNAYTDEKLETPTGMSGTWIDDNGVDVYWSIPRDMARFGLLVLNKGTWDKQPVLTDQTYFEAMVNTSQNLNPSYGYLWWLNGKSSIRYPGSTLSFNAMVAPDAPADLIVAAGKNGQFADVIPSRNMVVVRMGEAPDGSLVPLQFHNEMWVKLMQVIN